MCVRQTTHLYVYSPLLAVLINYFCYSEKVIIVAVHTLARAIFIIYIIRNKLVIINITLISFMIKKYIMRFL